MSDFDFSPADGVECPNCGVDGSLTALLGPANCARCHNDDCPIRDYWTIATREDFGIEGEPIGDIDFEQ